MHFECTPCLHFIWVFPLFSSPPKNLKCKTSYWVLTTDSKVHSDICSHFEFGPVPSPDPFPSLLPPSPAPPAIHREFVGVARDGGDINIWPLSPSADLFICFLCETPWLSKQTPHPLNPSVSHQRPLESAAACLVASTHPSAWLVGTDVQPVVTCAVWTTSLRISSQRKSSELCDYPKAMPLNTFSICKICENRLLPVQRVPLKCLVSFNEKYHSCVVIGSPFTWGLFGK